MAVTNRMNLLLFCLFCYYEIQPAACKPVWMSPKFPCDVTADNNSEVIFDCKERLLTRVPYGITSNVTQLNLSENHISNISVKSFPNLPNLTLLDLSWANKKDCLNFDVNAFKNMTKLNHLKLAGNCVNEIPRYLPPSVEKISLDNNRIVKLGNRSFAGLTNVTHLWLSRNCYIWNPCGNFMTIEEGSFAVMTKLETLDLSFNNLSHVPKGLPQTLYNLKLDHNRIESILEDDFRGLHNLQILKIQGNCPRCQNAPYPCVPCKNGSLGIHPDAFHSLTELLMLHLGGNSLDYLNPSWFKSLSKLRDIFLSFNYLIKVITEDATFLKYIPMIQKIDLSFNFALRYYPTTLNLAQEFSNLTSLRTLHLEGLVFQNIEEGTLRSLYELKNLSALNLGTNFIIHSKSAIFKRFQHVKMIYLAENRLYPVSVTNTPYTSNGYIQRSDFSVSPLTTSHRKYPDYELTHTLIKKECFDSGRVLILSSNNLFFITPQQFDGYGDIACLNLSGNGFSAALNGTEFSSLPNLTYLDLSYNKIDLAYDYAFQELSKLKVLDLSHNSHYFEAYGITHNLHFIKNLPVLRVLNMSHNSISTLATKQMHSKSLTELQFTNNHLGTMWKERDGTYEMLFTNLTNLTILDISENEITKIPFNVYGHLPQNLTKLYIQKNLLTDFNWTALKHFPQLEILDLSFNSLSNVSSVNAKVTQSLTFLDLTGNHIFQLDSGFIKGPKSLTTVSLSHNKLTTINQSTFQMTPDNQIQTLFLQGNPFECTCDSLDFILWLENSGIKIPRLTTQVTCATPENQRNKVLIYFDINQCVNNSLAFLIYTVTASVIIAFMFVVTVAHLFYWDAFYVIYYIKAKWKGYRSLNSSDSIYDVFVTYDTNDPQVSEWVMSNLRVELEDEEDKHLPLCLEERDWTPGVPLVDNLTQSIQYSRKTLFVLTEGYVKTGVFKLAMYLAHQRLLDENVDVIVLLMLEPVLQHSHFLRLRRRLCEKSVVVWPRTAAAEPWFWQNLRNVVRVDNQVIYNKTYSKYFASK